MLDWQFQFSLTLNTSDPDNRIYSMKRLDILIPHERLTDVNELLHKHKVGGMSFYEIKEGEGKKGARFSWKRSHAVYSRIWLSH